MKERLLDVMKIGLIIVIVGAVFYVLAVLLKRDPLTLFSIWLTALATIAIAICAFFSYQLASKIQTRDEGFKQEMKDLFHAMVLSNLLSSDHQVDRRISMFLDNYKGATRIEFKRTNL